MLSAFLKFVNRERALSFSAALCLLTLFAAVLPGVFQEDNPFDNASLWEGAEPAEQADSFVSASSSPVTEIEPLEESIEPIDFAHEEAVTDELVSVVELNPEVELDSGSQDGFFEQAEPFFEADSEQPGAGEIETPQTLDASHESPTLEPELEEPESTPGELVANDALEAEVEFETPVTTNLTEANTEELEAELPAEMPDDLDLQLESQGNLDSQVATIAPSQELLLKTPTANDQDESVYRGEFWSPPLTPELQSSLAPHVVPSTEATELLPNADIQVFAPIPPFPFPEFDWSQPQPARLGSTDSEISKAVVPVDPSLSPLGSPQELSGGYQPFAAGNPSLGRAVGLNPMQSLPLPDTIIMPHDPPQVQNFQLGVFSESPVRQPVASPVDTNQVGAYQSFHPASELGQRTLDYSSKVRADLKKTPQANPMPQATSKCPLFSRFCSVSSRHKACKLRSFKLCPAQGDPACQDQACKSQTYRPRVTRGLLKNWFNRKPTQHQCGICNWLRATPSREPVRFATNRLLQHNVRPLSRLAKWLLELPRHRPLLGLEK